jgi:membrane protein DedA with SNARE-associated domain
MEHLAQDIGAFIARNAVWAGPVLGLITFGESMAFIGAFFPATALMMIAGGLAAAGILDPFAVIAWCVAGAVLGDAVSYWIGRRLGPGAFRSPLMRRHSRTVARARLFFRKWGAASIYLCRFLGPVRAFVPLIAGMTAMNQLRFQLANLGSAVVWVPIMLAPGYLAAKGAQVAEIDAVWVVVGVLVVGAAVFFGRRLWRARKAPAAGRSAPMP